MGGEVAYDLIACDAHTDGSADGFAGYFSCNHVGIACYEAGEKLEDGNLEVRRCICIDSVVGLDDNEASVIVCCRGEGGRA